MKTYTLEEIKELCEGATSGPWAACYDGSGDWSLGKEEDPQELRICASSSYDPKNISNNFKFIAASREIIPQLVGQLEKAIEYIREIVCVPKGSEADKRLLKELGVE